MVNYEKALRLGEEITHFENLNNPEKMRIKWTQVAPWTTQYRTLGRELLRYEQEFGLTPSSRSQVTIHGNKDDDPLERFGQKAKWWNRLEFYFDEDRAEHVKDFVRSWLVHSKGKSIKNFTLLPWQSVLLEDLFGWVRVEDDLDVIAWRISALRRSRERVPFLRA